MTLANDFEWVAVCKMKSGQMMNMALNAMILVMVYRYERLALKTFPFIEGEWSLREDLVGHDLWVSATGMDGQNVLTGPRMKDMHTRPLSEEEFREVKKRLEIIFVMRNDERFVALVDELNLYIQVMELEAD